MRRSADPTSRAWAPTGLVDRREHLPIRQRMTATGSATTFAGEQDHAFTC